jgi:hypothetical protein
MTNTSYYPLPAKLGKLFHIETMTSVDNVHSSLLEDVTTESLLKLLKYKLWVDYQIRMNKSSNLEEVVKKELKLYENQLGMKNNTTVRKAFFCSPSVFWMGRKLLFFTSS